jgi:hypothetical protein
LLIVKGIVYLNYIYRLEIALIIAIVKEHEEDKPTYEALLKK